MIDAQNPFFEKYNTPHGTVPFDKIKTEHYEPAIREGIRQHIAEINAITDNPEVPTFDNTLLAYEKSGDLLNRVVTVFSNLRSAETNDDLQILAQKMMPLLSEHDNDISLNEKLFERIKMVYDRKEQLNLTAEQMKLLENVYDGFIRQGANLKGEAKEEYRRLTKELSSLTLEFSENNLKETNNYQLILTDKARIAGKRRRSSCRNCQRERTDRLGIYTASSQLYPFHDICR
jgi:peptidyl-dipeptidase Dcp